jgi:hypothetical protein
MLFQMPDVYVEESAQRAIPSVLGGSPRGLLLRAACAFFGFALTFKMGVQVRDAIAVESGELCGTIASLGKR